MAAHSCEWAALFLLWRMGKGMWEWRATSQNTNRMPRSGWWNGAFDLGEDLCWCGEFVLSKGRGYGIMCLIHYLRV